MVFNIKIGNNIKILKLDPHRESSRSAESHFQKHFAHPFHLRFEPVCKKLWPMNNIRYGDKFQDQDPNTYK